MSCDPSVRSFIVVVLVRVVGQTAKGVTLLVGGGLSLSCKKQNNKLVLRSRCGGAYPYWSLRLQEYGGVWSMLNHILSENGGMI